MVDASKRKPKKARVYTEEQKQVLVDRLKKAREKKAEKTKNSKPSPEQKPELVSPPVQKLEPVKEPAPKPAQEAKIEKVEQQIEIESKKPDPNNDMLMKLMDKLNKLESRLTESVKPVKQLVENKPSTLPPIPQKIIPPTPKPQPVIRDYIGLRGF